MEILENETTKILIRPDDIVEIYTKETWDQPDTVETALAAALLVKKAVGGKRRATLNFVPSFYVRKEIVTAFNSVDAKQVAGAMVVDSFGAKILGNLALKFHKNSCPAKMFTQKAEAEAWLLQFLEKDSKQ
jgi:hypothetical protein